MKNPITKSSNDLLRQTESNTRLYRLAGQLLEQSEFYIRLKELIDKLPDPKSREEILKELEIEMTKTDKKIRQLTREIQGSNKELEMELTHLADATYPN